MVNPYHFQIFTSNGKPASFYIQSHGNNAGRPLRQPIRNCFAVITDCPDAFHIVECLFLSGQFREELIGTAIPFLRLRVVKKIVGNAIQLDFSPKYMQLLHNLEKHLKNNAETKRSLQSLIYMTARQALNKAQQHDDLSN